MSMARKFQVPNPLTGIATDVDTIEEAIALRDQRITEYMQHIAAMFRISVMVQHPSLGYWIQAAANEQGEPVTVDDAVKAYFELEASGEPWPTPEDFQQAGSQA